ncbi:MAG: hypothetical protein R3B91_00360 [Planctomycetaceae bacterium]
MHPHCPNPACRGELTGTERDFNLMFKTIVGALGTEDDAAFSVRRRALWVSL